MELASVPKQEVLFTEASEVARYSYNITLMWTVRPALQLSCTREGNDEEKGSVFKKVGVHSPFAKLVHRTEIVNLRVFNLG